MAERIPPPIASNRICDACGADTYTVSTPTGDWCKTCVDKAFYLQARSDWLKRTEEDNA